MKAIHQRYRVLYPLEKGPDARVFLVRDLWQDEAKRVLTLLPVDVSSRTGRRRFEEIYWARAGLTHPCLAPLRGFAMRGRRAGLVSDFLASQPLSREQPSARLIPGLAVQMAELLACLHQRQFHCGALLPSQIYCTPQGHLAANILAPHDRQGCGPSCRSHVRYAAPEHLQSGICSVQADLYSLGMILYHLFTESPPYFEVDAEELLHKQLMADPAPPRKIQADIPEAISELILALIHKDPELRPESARYVLSALRKFGKTPGGRSVPELKLAVLGRESEMERFRRLLAEFQQDKRSRLVVIEGVAGIGKSTLLKRLEFIAQLNRLPVYRWTKGSTAVLTDSVPVAAFWDDWRPDASHAKALLKLLEGPVARLVVLTLRKEESPDAARFLEKINPSSAERLELVLGPLDRLESRRLVDALLGQCPPEVESRVLDQCSGNPFFLFEFLRQMERSGELRFQDGRWCWNASALSSRQLPAAVVENVRVRIQRLPALTREIVEALSLFDRPAPLEMLAHAVSRPAADMEDEIRRLEGLEMARLGGSLASALAFVHHLWMRRAVRSSLPNQRRRKIHLGIVRYLEGSLGPNPSSELLESLARHSLQAEDRSLARKYLWPAAESLQADSLQSEAALLLEEAYESRLLPQEDLPVCTRLMELLFQCGKLEKCIRAARELLGNLGPDSDPRHRILVLSLLGRAHLLKGEISLAVEALEMALPYLDRVQDLEAENELRAELLGCLALQGEVKGASRLAEQLSSQARRRDDPSFEKVCHALFLFFSRLLDQPEEAARWEAQAIELAYRRRQNQRSLGRLLNLAMLEAGLGRLGRAQGLIRFVRQDAFCQANPELDAFSQLAASMLLGRQGLCQQAVKQLRQLFSFNQRLNSSRNIEAGIHIELAENFNRLLQPESALREAEQCRRLLKSEYKLDDAADAALAEAQSWMLLGQPDRTRQILSGLDRDNTPVRQARRCLILTRLLLMQGEAALAEQQAVKALQLLSAPRAEERNAAHLLLAEACLRSGQLHRAQQALVEASRASQAGRLPSRQAEACRLLARLEREQGRPDRAKACCLRGLQIASRLEHPFLTARLQIGLGQAWLSLGDKHRAQSEIRGGLQFLKQCLYHVQPGNRNAFSRLWIDPVEQDLGRALPSGSPVVPRYLTELRQFNALLAALPDSGQVGQQLLEAAGKCVSSSGNLFLRSHGMEPFEMVASRGRCLRSGRHLLDWSESPHAVLAGKVFSRGNGSFTEIGVRLIQQGRMQGMVYLERPGSAPSEEDLDFLACLAASAELSLSVQPSGNGAGRPIQAHQASGVPMVAQHPSMLQLLEEVARIAPTTATVLISGESGTGKELVARSMHALSTRRQGPFVAVNCSGLSAGLIESELFGYSKGSFTGAGRDRRGLFEAADRGTLFLDEVASMPSDVQRSLLRALESRSVRRVGETHERKVDVRILSATNQQLGRLVETGAFRPDLYHRLRVCELHIPPLRRRRSDIAPLCQLFLDELGKEGGRKIRLSKEAAKLLQRMDFPGNVRELRNLLESAYYLCSGNQIEAGDLAARIDPSQGGSNPSRPGRRIVEGLIRGQLEFWKDVRDPFLRRDLSRRDVQEIVSLGLARCEGNYRRLTELFRLPRDDYKRLMAFLGHHGCKVDFRKFRSG